MRKTATSIFESSKILITDHEQFNFHMQKKPHFQITIIDVS